MARVWQGARGPPTKRRSNTGRTSKPASRSPGGSAGSVPSQQLGTQTLAPDMGPILNELLNANVDSWLFNENTPIISTCPPIASAEANAAQDVQGSPLNTNVSDGASLNATNPERNEGAGSVRRFRSIQVGNGGEPVAEKLPIGLCGDRLSPPEAIRHVTTILHLHWPGPFNAWSEVLKDPRALLWTKFKETYNVPLDSDDLYRKAFNVVATERLKNVLSNARKQAAKVHGSDDPKDWVKGPEWMDEGDWNALVKKWSDAEWRDQSARNRKNRETKKDGAIPTHSAGSISFAEHRSRMAEELGRDPTFEEWFANMHRSKNAPSEYVDNRAKRVLEYKALKLVKYGTTETAARVDFDIALWKKACGGKTKGYVYGLGARYMKGLRRVPMSSTGEELLFTRSQLVAAVAEGINAAHPGLISEVLAAVQGNVGVQGNGGVQGMEGVVSTSNEDGQPTN